MDATLWYAVRIDTMHRTDGYMINDFNAEVMDELTEHLSMNGYTFDTNGDDVIFIYEDEVGYLLTILEDRNLKYEVL